MASSEVPMDLDVGKTISNQYGNIGNVTVLLHPLVIMNISEHWTRFKAQEGQPKQVYGALIGKQNGRNIEIMNSFELVTQKLNNEIVVDTSYYEHKELQFKQVFKDLDFIGWYTTGSDVANDDDLKIHQQICSINDSPLFLKLNPFSASYSELPISIYESLLDMVDGVAEMTFIQLPYKIETEEAERIGVEHVNRVSNSCLTHKSAVADHLRSQFSAIKMLHGRIKLLKSYLESVKMHQLPINHEILRQCRSLVQRLPVMHSSRFHNEFYQQADDVALMTYLATITKCCSDANKMVDNFNVLYGEADLRKTFMY